jgi:hypothetical protein
LINLGEIINNILKSHVIMVAECCGIRGRIRIWSFSETTVESDFDFKIQKEHPGDEDEESSYCAVIPDAVGDHCRL